MQLIKYHTCANHFWWCLNPTRVTWCQIVVKLLKKKKFKYWNVGKKNYYRCSSSWRRATNNRWPFALSSRRGCSNELYVRAFKTGRFINLVHQWWSGKWLCKKRKIQLQDLIVTKIIDDIFQADNQYLKGPHITAVDEKGLETAVLGLEFRVANKHFKRGDMKLKCLATIATVYLQSNEESVEGDERILKAPVMESRETRAQSHTRNDLINGKIPGESPLTNTFIESPPDVTLGV